MKIKEEKMESGWYYFLSFYTKFWEEVNENEAGVIPNDDKGIDAKS